MQKKSSKSIFWHATSVVFCLSLLTGCAWYYPELESYFNPPVEGPNPKLVQDFIIVTPSFETKLSPLSLAPAVRTRLINVYDTLVSTDTYFDIQPGLAQAWGRLDDKTWEFTLREDLKFSDGTLLTTDDIIQSFTLAKNSPSSDLKNLLANFSEVSVSASNTILIKTKTPEPLLLKKVAQVLIFSQAKQEGDVLPLGTGPYYISSGDSSNFILEKNSQYWGVAPLITRAHFVTTDDNIRQQELAFTGECGEFLGEDIAHPCGLITTIPTRISTRLHTDLKAYEFSTLTTTYLVWNYYSDLYKFYYIRQAMNMALDRDDLARVSGLLMQPSTQFVASGTFGHNPNLTLPVRDNIQAKTILKENKVHNPTLVLDYLPGNEILVQYLKDIWFEIGINIETHEVTIEELKARALAGQSDLYLATWQVQSGDAGEFLNEAIHTPTTDQLYGQYNWSGYKNAELDQQIEQANFEIDWQKRLDLLRKVFAFSVSDISYGLPLLESSTMYALNTDFTFVPRSDGLLYLSLFTPTVSQK